MGCPYLGHGVKSLHTLDSVKKELRVDNQSSIKHVDAKGPQSILYSTSVMLFQTLVKEFLTSFPEFYLVCVNVLKGKFKSTMP